jgi:hypothetical protein
MVRHSREILDSKMFSENANWTPNEYIPLHLYPMRLRLSARPPQMNGIALRIGIPQIDDLEIRPDQRFFQPNSLCLQLFHSFFKIRNLDGNMHSCLSLCTLHDFEPTRSRTRKEKGCNFLFFGKPEGFLVPCCDFLGTRFVGI